MLLEMSVKQTLIKEIDWKQNYKPFIEDSHNYSSLAEGWEKEPVIHIIHGNPRNRSHGMSFHPPTNFFP